MRFLVDEWTGPHVATWLHSLGHEVFSVFDQIPGEDDEFLLDKALAEDWIIITNDKDFGELVNRQQHKHRGIVLLRLDDERTANKIYVLKNLLEKYADRLHDSFVTVTRKAVRFARD
jgi:predicted nuclease of predicted toxin-antitoxin system